MMHIRALTIAVVAGLLPVTTFIPQATAQDFGADAVYQLQQLQEEVRQLRGLVEQQQRELERLRQRQRDQYLDLDSRLQAAGAGQAGTGFDGSQNSAAAGVGFTQRDFSADPNSLPGQTTTTDNTVPAVLPGPSVLPRNDNRDAGSAVNGDGPATRPLNGGSGEPSAAELAALGEPEVRGEINTQATVTTLDRPQIRSTGSTTVGVDEQGAYDQAFNELKALRYERAADGFRNFIQRYPDSRLADNAQYWLGESYYGARNFTMALAAFQALLDRYPDSGKRADALLKVGYSHYELRQWAAARAALEQVQAEHPDTTIARLAENRLRTMRLEGNF